MNQYKDILSGLYNYLENDLSKESLSNNNETKRIFFTQQLLSLGICSQPISKIFSETSNLNSRKRHSLPVINNKDQLNNLNNSSFETPSHYTQDDSYNQETLKLDSKFQSSENIDEDNIYEIPKSSQRDINQKSIGQINENDNVSYKKFDEQATISKNSAMLLPRKSFLQTRRLSVNSNYNNTFNTSNNLLNNNGECGWTLMGPLMHRVKHNKWVKMNSCLLTSNARLIAFKAYPIKSTLFTSSSANWSNSASLCIYLCGAHGLYAARDSGMNHVIKISAPGTDYETHVFATENEQQALIWTDQINQYGSGNVPSHSFSFIDKELVSTFTMIPVSLHTHVTYVISKTDDSQESLSISQDTQLPPDVIHTNKINNIGLYMPMRRDHEIFHRRANNLYDIGVFHNLDYNVDESQENLSQSHRDQHATLTPPNSMTLQQQTSSKRNSLLSSVRKRMEQQFPSKRRLSVQQQSVDNSSMVSLISNEISQKSLTISSPIEQSSPKLNAITSGLNWSQLSVGGHIFLRKTSYPSQICQTPNSFMGYGGNPSNTSPTISHQTGSPCFLKKDGGSLTPSVRIRTSLRRASLSAFKFNQSSSISDLSQRNNTKQLFEQTFNESFIQDYPRDPDELVSGEAQICIPDLAPWTSRWCSLRNDCLNIYPTPVRPPPNQQSKPIFSLTLRHGLVHLELANDKRYRAAIKLSAPSLSKKCLFFHIADKIIIGAWIRGFIQALGMIRPSVNSTTTNTHMSPLNLNYKQTNESTTSTRVNSSDLDSPVYSEITMAKDEAHYSNIRPFSMIETNYEDKHASNSNDHGHNNTEEEGPLYDEVFHIQQTSLPIEISTCQPNESNDGGDLVDLETLNNRGKTAYLHDLLVDEFSTKTSLRKATSIEVFPERPLPAKSILAKISAKGKIDHPSCDEEIYDEIAVQPIPPPNNISSPSIVTVGRSISCKCPVFDNGRSLELSRMAREQQLLHTTSNTLPTITSRTLAMPNDHSHSSVPASAVMNCRHDLPPTHHQATYSTNSTSSFYSSSLSSRTAASSGLPLNSNGGGSSLNQSECNTRPSSSSFGGGGGPGCSSSPFKSLQDTSSIYCNEDYFGNGNQQSDHEFTSQSLLKRINSIDNHLDDPTLQLKPDNTITTMALQLSSRQAIKSHPDRIISPLEDINNSPGYNDSVNQSSLSSSVYEVEDEKANDTFVNKSKLSISTVVGNIEGGTLSCHNEETIVPQNYNTTNKRKNKRNRNKKKHIPM